MVCFTLTTVNIFYQTSHPTPISVRIPIIRDSNLLLCKFSDVLVFTSRGGNVTNQFKVHGKFSLDSMKVSKSCLIIEQVVMSKSKERKEKRIFFHLMVNI